ncbi:MAG: SMC-Scp complex subunit ScpB [Candidatus Nanoarchaeia archaeon]|nr:SMC-Scp complex subunit ScpB [Candidatus Nanoarchaeia archaeon]
MEDYVKRIEAVLFTTGRFMDLDEIAKMAELGSVGYVKDAIEELKKKYESTEGSLTILEENGKFKLSIKKEFNYLTTKLLESTEIDNATMNTLALIAYNRPALQSNIIKMRGNGAYDHIKLLKDEGFVLTEKKGRTRVIELAPKFFDYFDIVEDQLKSKLNEKINQENEKRDSESEAVGQE